MLLIDWLRRFPRRPRRMSGLVRRPQTRHFGSVEALEDRTLLTVFTVNSVLDAVDANPGDGVAEDAGGDTTLRAAIMEANALAGPDTINLPAGTYTLSIAGSGEDAAATGDLDITDTSGGLSIIGDGAASTIIDANQLDRVFHVFAGVALDLEAATVTGGNLDTGTGLASKGGGIFNAGTLSVIGSMISGNFGKDGGGGISTREATVSVTITDSTISGNTAYSDGGGIEFNSTAASTMTITNSTISGNSAISGGHAGGGIFVSGLGAGPTLTLTNTTISDNLSGNSTGGGIRIDVGTVNVQNTIIAGNTGGDTSGGGTLVDLGNNIIGGDPVLGPLQDNGGPTFTHAPLVGSPAIDAGDNSGVSSSDQRNFARLRDGDGDATATVDIGAVEYIAAFDVSSTADTVDASPGDGVAADAGGDTTLRAAIMEANALAGPDRINLPAGTYTLSIAGSGEDSAATGDLDITDELTISGSGPAAAATVIDAAEIDRVLHVFDGVLFTISDLTITGGDAGTGRGGGLLNNGGVVEFSNAVIASNSASKGAGLQSSSGTVTLQGTSFDQNVAEVYGGGMNFGATWVTVVDSSFLSNTAGESGGAIALSNAATLDISNSSFTGNSAGNFSGAINNNATTTIDASDFSGNSAEWGGAIASGSGTLVVTDSNLTSNSATQGGAIYNNHFFADSSVTITGSTLDGNSAELGGAVYNGNDENSFVASLTLINSTLSGNSATNGAGILNMVGGVVTVEDSTISGNVADGQFEVQLVGAIDATQTTIEVTAAWAFPSEPRFLIVIDDEKLVVTEISGNTLTVTRDLDSGTAHDDNASVVCRANGGGGIFNDGTLTIVDSSLTDNRADAESNGHGGGVHNLGDLTVASSRLEGNSAAIYGGGIYNGEFGNEGTLAITNSTLSSNSASNAGGAIMSGAGTVEITDSTLADNSTSAESTTSNGGGLSNHIYSTVTISGVTFTGNEASYGGAIRNYGNDNPNYDYLGTINITNSTFSGNVAFLSGGAITSRGGKTTLDNSTIVDNTSEGQNGGIFNTTTSVNPMTDTDGILEIRNTIVAANSGASNPDIGGPSPFTSLGNNLVGDAGSVTGFVNGVNGDQVGTSASPIAPQLGPLQDNGGPTETHALLAGSPAIDAGDNSGVSSGDQRNFARLRDGDGDATATVDVGAVEYIAAFDVSSMADAVDANPGDGVAADAGGDTTLRAAIIEANALAGPDTINLPPWTYTLAIPGSGEDAAATGDLDITDDLTISGAGPTAASTVIDADGIDRVFQVVAGASVEISGVTITGGSALSGGGIANSGNLEIIGSTVDNNRAEGESAAGGGISNGAVLTITNSTVSNNHSDFYSGGILNNGYLVWIHGSTISGNSAERRAGGIWNRAERADMEILNSTISGNTAKFDAGILNGESDIDEAKLSLINVTVTENSATESGGGVRNRAANGELSILNTIIAANSAPTGPDVLGSSPFTSLGNNLIGDMGSASGFTDGVNGDIVGSSGSLVDPQLGPLQNNGGPVATHNLLSGSPAIDAGSNDGIASTDQRGVPRRLSNSGSESPIADIGGVEYIAPFDLGPTPNVTAGWFADNDADDFFRIAPEGTNIEVTVNRNVWLRKPASELTSLTVTGSGDDDTLVIDLGGFAAGVTLGRPVTFDGGGEVGTDWDTLEITNGSATSITHDFSNASDGTIDIDGNVITYTGLEPISDNLSAVDRIFSFGATADEITIADNGIAGDGISRISSTSSSETVDFANPSGSLTINAGDGDDTITILSLDSLFSGSLTINGQSDDDTLVIDLGGLAAGVALGRPVTFNGGGEADDGDTLEITNGSATSITHDFSNASDGTIDIDGNVISYTGLEPISDNLSAVDRIFSFGATGDEITIADNGIAGDGISRISSTSSSETVDFANPSGSLTINAGDGDDTITILSLDSLFSGSLTINGHSGNDTIDASAIDVAVKQNGFAGNDTLTGGSAADTLNGGSGSDSLTGGAGNDRLQGQGASYDTLSGGPGDDTLDGGSGYDRVSETADVDFTATDSSLSGLGTDALSNIQLVQLFGGSSANTIDASAFTGRAFLNGAGGNDTLSGGGWYDRIFGGSGRDLITGGDSVVDAGTGLFSYDVLRGQGGNNDTLIGGAGADKLNGGAGHDSVLGGGGDDVLIGESGNDTLDGGAGTDRLYERADVDMTLTDGSLTGGLGTDVLASLETAYLKGGSSNNLLDATGFSGDVTLIGMGGDDTIKCGSGNCKVYGRSGNDSLLGGDGDDTLLGLHGNDTLNGGAGNDWLDGGTQDDSISGWTGNDYLYGRSGNDILVGGVGNDSLYGASGDDILAGDDGKNATDVPPDDDYLDGGDGSDTVRGGGGSDTIVDDPSEIDEEFEVIAPWIDAIG